VAADAPQSKPGGRYLRQLEKVTFDGMDNGVDRSEPSSWRCRSCCGQRTHAKSPGQHPIPASTRSYAMLPTKSQAGTPLCDQVGAPRHMWPRGQARGSTSESIGYPDTWKKKRSPTTTGNCSRARPRIGQSMRDLCGWGFEHSAGSLGRAAYTGFASTPPRWRARVFAAGRERGVAVAPPPDW